MADLLSIKVSQCSIAGVLHVALQHVPNYRYAVFDVKLFLVRRTKNIVSLRNNGLVAYCGMQDGLFPA
jgi:hypothetical protein